MVFFSSRRRHTRFDCDWSSDVCSSDLDGMRIILSGGDKCQRGVAIILDEEVARRVTEVHQVSDRRSEERRVGKECRSGGAAKHEKRKKGEVRRSGGTRGGGESVSSSAR